VKRKTLELTPSSGEMLKPSELIELQGTGRLTLEDRRLFNTLIENAWGKHLGEPGAWFELSTSELKLQTESNARLRASIKRLMTTIVVVTLPNGGERLLQLLSTSELETTANRGLLRYCFPPKLAELLSDSTIFAKLDLEVMKSFSSKYGFSLYEAVSRRLRLKHMFVESLSIEELRTLLGVEDGKLTSYGNLNKFAIEPALEEVNGLAPFNVYLATKKQRQKVVGFAMSWEMKSEAQMKEAYAELHRSRVGRKARLSGTSDVISDDPTTS
jgi:hypothetical protein